MSMSSRWFWTNWTVALKSAWLNSYGMFHPRGPYFLLSCTVLWRNATPYSIGFHCTMLLTSKRSWFIPVKGYIDEHVSSPFQQEAMSKIYNLQTITAVLLIFDLWSKAFQLQKVSLFYLSRHERHAEQYKCRNKIKKKYQNWKSSRMVTFDLK